MAHVSQREDRLAAVPFAARDGGDGACRRDGRLRCVAYAVLLDAFDDTAPIELWPAPRLARIDQRPGRTPFQILRIVDAALDRREGSAAAGQVDARAHAVVADDLHDLAGQLLPLFAAIAHAEVVPHVAK